jgi:hypothetical protein
MTLHSISHINVGDSKKDRVRREGELQEAIVEVVEAEALAPSLVVPMS